MLAFPGRPGVFDHPRLCEDLRSMPGPIAEAARQGRVLRPPLALLERYGADLLFATPADRGARALRADDALRAWLAEQPFGTACGGAVALSWLGAAVALGRTDLRPRFRAGDRLDLDAMLGWLVLHGIAEHGVYDLATARFLRELLRPGPGGGPGGIGPGLAPLALMLLRERPDLRAACDPGAGGLPAGLRAWLAQGGTAEYRLHWCLPPRDHPPGPRPAEGWAPPAEPPPEPAGPPPPLAGRQAVLHLDRDGPLPDCVSERALGRAAAGGGAVYATDLALRLPHPGTRRATLLIHAAPLGDGPAGGPPRLLVALLDGWAVGAALLDPEATGPVALTLDGLPAAEALELRLCLADDLPRHPARPWARWLSLWLAAG